MKKRMLLVLVMSVSFTPLVFANDDVESSGAGQQLAMQVPAPANSCPYSNYVKPDYPSNAPVGKTQSGQKHDAGKI